MGDIPPIVSAILPSGVTMNVVRSAKPWPISMPRVSFAPSRAARTCSPYDRAMSPLTSEATASLPAQYSGSAEKSLSRSMLSSETPMTLAPAALKSSICTANSRAWMLQPCV